jgi:hypothetical protein
MQPQVTFRGIFPSEAIVDAVWQRARVLTAHAPEIELCHVVIERLSREGEAKARFRVSLLLGGSEASPERRFPDHSVSASDVDGALREVFAQARRRFARPWLLPRAG